MNHHTLISVNMKLTKFTINMYHHGYTSPIYSIQPNPLIAIKNKNSGMALYVK